MYAGEDVVFGEQKDTTLAYKFSFENCLLRTDSINRPERLKDIIWEKASDAIQGTKHFVLVDENNLIYNFHLLETSPAFEKQIGWTGSYR